MVTEMLAWNRSIENCSSLNKTCWIQMVNFVYVINNYLKFQIFNLLKSSKMKFQNLWGCCFVSRGRWHEVVFPGRQMIYLGKGLPKDMRIGGNCEFFVFKKKVVKKYWKSWKCPLGVLYTTITIELNVFLDIISSKTHTASTQLVDRSGLSLKFRELGTYILHQLLNYSFFDGNLCS